MNVSATAPDAGLPPARPLKARRNEPRCDIYAGTELVASLDHVPDTNALTQCLAENNVDTDCDIRLECQHRNPAITWDLRYTWNSAHRKLVAKH